MLLCLLHEIEFRSEVGKLDGLHADGEILGRLDAGVFVGKGNGKRREAFHVRAAGEAARAHGAKHGDSGAVAHVGYGQ